MQRRIARRAALNKQGSLRVQKLTTKVEFEENRDVR